ncbi:multicopper oxidase domain-containing protein [Haloplasma contractile]
MYRRSTYKTYGYNGNFFSPVIRVRLGNQVRINVKNKLNI